jgi:nitrite reductase/ring-hydroxylating ferredoxin subunit
LNDSTDRICGREELVDGGLAKRFTIHRQGKEVACFAVAFDGAAYAFENCCPHRGTELDWQPGEVFDPEGLYLVCATHGALFEPDSGRCVAGPCKGAELAKVPLTLRDGYVVASCDGLADEPKRHLK